MGDPQTWNAYAYTSNNPLNRVDPDGQRWAQQLRDGMIHYQWFDHEAKDDNGLTAYDRAIGTGGGWSGVDFDESQSYIYQPGEAGKDYQLNPDGTHSWVTPVEGNSGVAMAGVAVAGRAAPGPSRGIVYAILAMLGLATAEQTHLLNNLPQPPGLDPNIYSQSKHNKEVIEGLIGTAVDHVEKIRNNPGSRDVPHWKGEIKAALDRAKNVAERLKGKTKEATKEKIREIEQQVDQ